MLLVVWRSLRGRRTTSTSQRPRSSITKRIFLSVEPLERRDLLSGFLPTYILQQHTGTAVPYASTSPTGHSPAQISQAYGFNQIGFNGGSIAGNGSGQTIAIVDAYSEPNIAGDLHAFDVSFGLPDPPSLRVVNQSGGGALPAANSSWGMEIALDVEWAHAVAPGANILLVEANSSGENDLFTAVQYAARQPGVSVVSMSWGGGEFSSENYYDSVFTTPAGHQGVAFIASSGDSGAPPSYPAVSPNVLAVGGTSLYLSGSNYGGESAWGGSTGGISSYEAKPSYQNGIVSQTSTHRTSPDVAYNADPNTGMSVYDSYGTPSGAPWLQVGGTSAGAPQWAGLVAIADQGRALKGLGSLDSGTQLLPMIYQLPSSDFHDVIGGSSTGSPGYPAIAGYDLVTGRGSPYAAQIVAALSQQTLTAPPPASGGAPGSGAGSPPGSSSPIFVTPGPLFGPIPALPSSSDPFTEVAYDAVYILQGWLGKDYTLLMMGWQDFVSTVYANPSQTRALELALISDVLADL